MTSTLVDPKGVVRYGPVDWHYQLALAKYLEAIGEERSA